ncbi:hypothetical protein ZWY2020_003016 [Hordeum vulgare]|nr:hypothetical protein ZWY2020_003016 [Hordeum vulgare]
MAQETLRLVCLPVSAHDGRLPWQSTLEGQGAKKDISPPPSGAGVPSVMLALVVQDIDADGQTLGGAVHLLLQIKCAAMSRSSICAD